MTSDGHLGGVDVHFKLIESVDRLVAVRENITAFDPPIVFLAGPADWLASLADSLPDAALIIPASNQPKATRQLGKSPDAFFPKPALK